VEIRSDIWPNVHSGKCSRSGRWHAVICKAFYTRPVSISLCQSTQPVMAKRCIMTYEWSTSFIF